MQMGFGFEVTDVLGNSPAFLWREPEVLAALDIISQAQWVSTDVETTGLTDASLPVALGNTEIKQGATNLVRMRTIQARVPTINGRHGPRMNFGFDTDKMGPVLTQKVAKVILSRRMFIAHNAGFDLYWLRRAEGRSTMPKLVVDTMLMTRCVQPTLVLRRCELIREIRHASEVENASPVVKAAWKSLISGASGGSLADVVLAMFGVVVDKTYQKPTNWTGLLGFGHYDYAIDDVYWADRILCKLLDIPDDGDLLMAYLSIRARRSTVRLIEPQVPELVLLRERGMPVNTSLGRKYVDRKRIELAKRVDELIALEPTLEPHRALLADPDAGQTDELKLSLAKAFEAAGVALRKTPGGMPQVGEKDLRACRAAQMEKSRPLFTAWVAVCRAKKTSAMALDVVGFAERSADGRVRSLLSHGPVTGRLAASEPNCFTGDTEILTERGWIRFDALPIGLRVAQYHKGRITFTVPSAYTQHAFDGHLVHNKSDSLDLLTTTDHRCLVLEKSTSDELVVSAVDYPEDHLQVHAGQFAGPGLRLGSKDLQFLVAAQTDGVWSDGGLLFTMASRQKVEHFKSRFAAFQSAADGSFFLPKKHRLSRLASVYLGEELSFGEWVFSLSRDQLDVFLVELATWHGTPAVAGAVTFNTSSEKSADIVHAAYALSKVRAIQRQDGDTWSVMLPDQMDRSCTSGRTQELVAHTGQVYCVSVPSEFIVVRRGGVSMVTGQCQQWPRDQLFRAMCMSYVLEGCDEMSIEVTPALRYFLEEILGYPVTVGDTVQVDTTWAAGLFYTDKLSIEATAETEALLSKCKGKPVTLGSIVSTEFSTVADILGCSAERKAIGKLIDAQFTHMIVASDFGALDVRVGAALCVRSQREMLDFAVGKPVPGPVQPPDEVAAIVKRVAKLLTRADAADALADLAKELQRDVISIAKQLEYLSTQLDAGMLARKAYWDRRRQLKDRELSVKLGWRFAQCLAIGASRGEREYSALRDAFVADIDIHTFTGMKLVGRDPMAEFEGLTPVDRKALEKKLKKELGPRRQQGKIANLSLLYGMADAGFQEAAARGYDEHWTMEQAHDIRTLWMDAYPEVELWHLWTECLQAGVVYVAEQGKEKPVRTSWYMARTLAGREIVAFGLNAALSYQDQSSGADILGLINHRLHDEYPVVFNMSINQVHDEQVFETPMESWQADLEIIETTMVEEANKLTMPFGVPCAVSPAVGPLWIKD